MKRMFTGTGVALITPFTPDGSKVDFVALGALVERLIKKGADFLVPCGTTGESPTLSPEEHVEVIRFVAEQSQGRVPVLAGTGSNSTAEAMHFTELAKKVGAKGVLVVSPYYNKPMPEGMIQHFRQIAGVGLPVILYDIPSRTGKGVPTLVIETLAKEGVIRGLKWASGDFSQLMYLLGNLPKDFIMLSGDDNLTFPAMCLGAKGVISVAANLFPDSLVEMVDGLLEGKYDLARDQHFKLLPVFETLFIETNPIPIKEALSYLNSGISKTLRLPLSPMSEANKRILHKVVLRFSSNR